MLNIVFIFLIFTSLGIIGWIVFRKFPQLRSLDVATVKEEQAARVRDRILLDRMMRSTKRGKELLKRGTGSIFSKSFSMIKKIFKRVYELEKEYEKKSHDPSKLSRVEMRNRINSLVEEGMNLMKASRFSEAEKIFIEVISLDHKNIDAYKKLGNVYLSLKEYKQALQTFEFVLKLELKKGSPVMKETERGQKYNTISNAMDVAAIYNDLGFVYRRLEKDNKALDSFLHAQQLEPNNPRHLDEIIEISIILKNKSLAFDMLKKLEEVNPENQKISEYSKKIKDL
jgi:tetratricopeptide (TPR) repeat protein